MVNLKDDAGPSWISFFFCSHYRKALFQELRSFEVFFPVGFVLEPQELILYLTEVKG